MYAREVGAAEAQEREAVGAERVERGDFGLTRKELNKAPKGRNEKAWGNASGFFITPLRGFFPLHRN